MPETTYNFLNMLSDNFMQNRLESVAEHFAYPMPVYAQGGLLGFGAGCTLSDSMTFYSDAILRAGIVRIVPRVVAEGLPVNGYSNVWVELDHVDATGTFMRTSQVRYVFYQADDALFPKIELMEYTSLAFPEVSASLYLAKIA